jgi:hypothetical protein
MSKLAESFTTRARTEGPVEVSGTMIFMWATIPVRSEVCSSIRRKTCCAKVTFTKFVVPALPKSRYEFLGVVCIPVQVCTLEAIEAKRPKCDSMQPLARIVRICESSTSACFPEVPGRIGVALT